MSRKSHIKKTTNLLEDNLFKTKMILEAYHLNTRKGGYTTLNLSEENKKSFIKEVNLLSSVEQKEMINEYFISKN